MGKDKIDLYKYYLSSSSESDDESNDINIDYKYKGSNINTSDFFNKKNKIYKQYDDIDDIIRLYEPGNTEYCIKKECNIKNKNSVWKKFIFLFKKKNKIKNNGSSFM